MGSRPEFDTAVQAIAPYATVTDKEFWIWGVLWWVITVLTVGIFPFVMPRMVFLHGFAQTLGPYIGIPWGYRVDLGGIRCALHEARHVKQFEWFGWAIPVLGWFFGPRVRAWCGILPMGLVYGLLPLPAGLALGRFLLELDAETAAWESIAETWPDKDAVAQHVADRGEILLEQLCGSTYFYCLPRSWGKQLIQRRMTQVMLRILTKNLEG